MCAHKFGFPCPSSQTMFPSCLLRSSCSCLNALHWSYILVVFLFLFVCSAHVCIYILAFIYCIWVCVLVYESMHMKEVIHLRQDLFMKLPFMSSLASQLLLGTPLQVVYNSYLAFT